MDWHSKTKFAGAGITEKGVLFSYHSNWESAGRWGIELNTYKRKIILRPLEEVQIQWKGTVNVEKHKVDLNFDNEFKPGLFLQLSRFLSLENSSLCSLSEQILMCKKSYRLMLN